MTRTLHILSLALLLCSACAGADDRPPIYGDDFKHMMAARQQLSAEWRHDRSVVRQTMWAVRPEDNQRKLAKQMIREFERMSEEGAFVVFTTGGCREVKIDPMLSAFARKIEDADCARLGIFIVSPASIGEDLRVSLTKRGIQIICSEDKGAEPGATDNPDDAQRFREVP